ncbi:MAG: HD-GYP domain-containing protein [Solirubrobacterales bacterium]
MAYSSPTRTQTRELINRILQAREPERLVGGRKIAALGRRLGRRIGMTEEQLDDIEVACELHDIGKMAIPDDVLHKPSRLEEAEWKLMRRHTEIAEHILSAVPDLSRVARIVRSGHEHFDGGGYPDGLRGEEIPVESRILLICTAFTAMTSERPYKRTMTEGEALAALQLSSGTQFDPDLVDAFVYELGGQRISDAPSMSDEYLDSISGESSARPSGERAMASAPSPWRSGNAQPAGYSAGAPNDGGEQIPTQPPPR